MSGKLIDNNRKRRGRPKTIDYDTTLAIAVNAYWSKGIDGMSVNEVCRLAKVSKPSLYREFGNEDGLLNAVFKYYGAGFHEKVNSVLNKRNGLEKNLEDLIHFVSFSGNQSISPKGCLAEKGYQSLERLGEKGKLGLEFCTHGTLDVFDEWVARTHDEMSLGKDWNRKLITEFIFSIFTHAMKMNGLGSSPEKIKRITTLALSPLVNRLN
ncbi:MAG: TetR/AcrR family transcriptional regulator [Paracoccaceae bacterium]|nr:TetR/AcrR family transcriptional regulator [Paracoccaceae bacterium]